MLVQITWFDGVTERVESDAEYPHAVIGLRRGSLRTCVRVGVGQDDVPVYVEDQSGPRLGPVGEWYQ